MSSIRAVERLIGAVAVLATSPEPLAERLRLAARSHLSSIDGAALSAPLEFVVGEIEARRGDDPETGLDDVTAGALAERVLILCVDALRQTP